MSGKRLILVFGEGERDIIGRVNAYFKDEGSCCEKESKSCTMCANSQSVGPRVAWLRFADELGYPLVIMNAREFQERHNPMWQRFPMVFLARGDKVERLIVTDEILECLTTMELLTLVESRLKGVE